MFEAPLRQRLRISGGTVGGGMMQLQAGEQAVQDRICMAGTLPGGCRGRVCLCPALPG